MEIEQTFINPGIERILRSSLHHLLSWRLALLEYDGHVTGNRRSTPVIYGRVGNSIVTTTDRHATTWWKNFRSSHSATLLINGEPIELKGQAELDPTKIEPIYAELSDQSWMWRFVIRLLGVNCGTQNAESDAMKGDIVLVVFK